ncbi:MAG: hypothetical protein ACOVQ7_19315, partial [Limnoraphis robusta]
ELHFYLLYVLTYSRSAIPHRTENCYIILERIRPNRQKLNYFLSVVSEEMAIILQQRLKE